MPEIKPEDFEAGCLKPLSYHEDEISKAIVANVKRLDTDDKLARQKEALERYKYLGVFYVATPENYEDVRRFFHIFDDLFFGGLLRESCRIEFFPSDKMDARFSGFVDGYCETELPG
ncbi:hypothetical protein G7Y89_g9586 [Cudoniella acicularis]|uniref:Uncharacterized protein n=1 Tax=Cudoniella acicularis TaxID=354080 RepID=A0A8H4RED1_9HELO|nr:hypothetical protein G7Y89_g9586 [Cudoniella acicularis]